jgi:hypothetical protein
MEVPIELWRAEILPHCAEYAPALHAVRREWRATPLPARRTKGKGLTYLAERGLVSLIAWTNIQRGERFMTPQLTAMFEAACRGGHADLARKLRRAGADCPISAFVAAVRGGDADLAFALFRWLGPSTLWPHPHGQPVLESHPLKDELETAICAAAEEGHTHILSALYDTWFGHCYLSGGAAERVLAGAAHRGDLALMRLALQQGARNLSEAAQIAAKAGRLPALKFACEWTPAEERVMSLTDFLADAVKGGQTSLVRAIADDEALRKAKIPLSQAVRGGSLELIQDCKRAGACDYDEMLCTAFAMGREDLCLLAREWGAKAGSLHLAFAAGATRHSPLEALFAWMKEEDYEFDSAELTLALRAAINRGDVDRARLLRERGAALVEDRDLSFLVVAAERGDVEMLRTVKEWIAHPKVSYTRLLIAAATAGEERAMELVWDWCKQASKTPSVMILNQAYNAALGARELGAVRLLRGWGANCRPEDDDYAATARTRASLDALSKPTELDRTTYRRAWAAWRNPLASPEERAWAERTLYIG